MVRTVKILLVKILVSCGAKLTIVLQISCSKAWSLKIHGSWEIRTSSTQVVWQALLAKHSCVCEEHALAPLHSTIWYVHIINWKVTTLNISQYFRNVIKLIWSIISRRRRGTDWWEKYRLFFSLSYIALMI